MKPFVTGAGGFVGSHLVDLLRSRECRVKGIAFPDEGLGPDLPACDILDFEALRRLVSEARPDVVFHLAAASNPRQSLEHPLHHYSINLQGTIHMLEAVRLECPGARLLLASTAQVYRPASPGQLLTEDARQEPRSPYASSKQLAELASLQYARDYGLRVVIARSFNQVGPRQDERYVLSDFCRQVAELEQLPLDQEAVIEVGNLDPERDFLDVRDGARAYWLLAGKGREGQIYNVAAGEGWSIRQVLDELLEQAARPITVRSKAAKRRSRDQISLVGDYGRLREDTGWQPRIPLRETIADTLAFWRERRESDQ